MELVIDERDLQRITGKLQRLSPKRQDTAIGAGFRNAALKIEADLKRNVSGPILKKRTGHLVVSIGSRVNGLTATIGSGVGSGRRLPYADIHETGGVIRPKRAKWLTIPSGSNRTPAGVMRFSPSDLDGVFFKKTKRGGLGLYAKRGKKSVLMFNLVKEVKIPARRYLTKTANQSKQKATRIIELAIEKELKR